MAYMAYPRREAFKSPKEKRLDALEGFRKETGEDARHSQDQFDKSLMTLSASGIGVTIAFLDKIVPFADASLKWVLFLVWLFWGCCLAVTLFSFYASTRGLLSAQEEIVKEWTAVYHANNPDEVKPKLKLGGKWNLATKVANEVAAILFGLGLLAMIIFIAYNLLIKPNPKPSSQKVNEGQVVAQRPPDAAPVTKGLPVGQRPPASDTTKKGK